MRVGVFLDAIKSRSRNRLNVKRKYALPRQKWSYDLMVLLTISDSIHHIYNKLKFFACYIL